MGTQQKYQIEKELNFYLDTVASHMPGCIYWKDRDGIYRGCSTYMAHASGLKSPKDIIGKTDYDFFSVEQADLLRENDKEVIAKETAITTEEIITLPDNKEHCFTVIKVPLRDKDRNIIGVIGNSLDITYQKNLEQELRKAKNKAEEADLAKTNFILNMEHDIRTPISHIAGMADILYRSQNLSEKEKRFIKAIQISAIRLLELIEEVLHFIDIESGRTAVTTTKLNFAEIIKKVVELSGATTTLETIDLVVDYDKNIPEALLSDPMRIHRILLNLIGNAFKFTEKGHIKIIAKLEEIKNDSVSVRLIVEDTGIGIPKDKQEVIFERFSKLHPSNTNKYQGLGLGLWIVSQFIKDLGGTIKVESEINVGTKFICIIPCKIPS